LVQSHDHPSAHDVYVRAKLVDRSVSFATVYRALATLADAGIVQRIAVDDGPARFEMAPETEHDHLVDVDTGEVLELASYELVALRCSIPDHHIDPRRSAFFMARSVLRDIRNGVQPC
jgi:Fur family ferric uptake transcriptional regulator